MEPNKPFGNGPGPFAGFVSDIGGLNQLLPVVQNLRAAGYLVSVFASGKSVAKLIELGESFVNVSGGVDETFISRLITEYRGILVTMNDKGDDPSLRVAAMLEGRLPVLAVQDAYAARLKTFWSCVRPTAIAVNDQVAKRIVLDAWPDMPPQAVLVTGKPSLDAVRGYPFSEARAGLEELYRFESRDRKVVYFGGALNCSGKPVLETVKVLNKLNQDVFLILRHHPRMSEDAPHQVRFWEEARKSFTGGTLLQNPEKVDPLIVTAGSDVAISTFSGVLDDAVNLRRPNIAVLYSKDAMVHYRDVTGGALNELPLTELGVTIKVASRQGFERQLGLLLGSGSAAEKHRKELRMAQEAAFPLDGKNSSRVAEAFLSLSR